MNHVNIPGYFLRAWRTEITFSKGRGSRTNHYASHRLAAEEFIADMTNHREGEKEGPAWSPFQYENNIRRADKCIGADVLVLDIDDGTSWREIRTQLLLGGHAVIVASSHSHESTRTDFLKSEYDKWHERNPRDHEEDFMRSRDKGYRRAVWRGSKVVRERDGSPLVKQVSEDGKFVQKITIEHAPCPKFRIIAPLVEQFRVSDYDSVATAADAWRRMCCAFADALALKTDPNAFLLTQLFFDPRHPPGVTPIVRIMGSNALDIAALMKTTDAKGRIASDRAVPHSHEPAPRRLASSGGTVKNPFLRDGECDYEAVRGAALAIRNDERFAVRREWLQVIGALHHATDGSAEGLEIAQEWCERSTREDDDPRKNEKAWLSLRRDRQSNANAASLLWLAKRDGWPPPAWMRPQIEMADERDQQAIIDAFNEEFAVIKNKGTVRILCEETDANGLDTFALLPERDFRLLTRNRGTVETNGTNGKITAIPAGVYWLNSSQRREYQALVFRPGEELRFVDGSNEHSRFYNLWRGWGVAASRAGSCALFLEHLRENVCNGDVEHFNWLLDWIAHIFQKSCEKPSVAVVLIGDKGTGKSIVGKVLGALIGRHHYFVLSQPQQLLGKFNAHLTSALLIQAEEAFFSLNPETRGILKDLISRETRSVEPKGVDAYMVDAYDRLLITSNEDAVVPAEPGERRYFVCRLSNKRARDTAYFAAIDEQMRNGGYERLLYDLLNRDLSNFDCRTAPVTSALREQTRQHMTPVAKWAFDALADETFWVMNDDWHEARRERRGTAMSDADYDPLVHGRIISKQTVRHDFSAYCRRLNLKSHMTDSDFGKWLTEHLGFRSVQRRTGDVCRDGGRDRTRLYQIPPNADARERFCRKLNIDPAMIAIDAAE